MAPENSNPKVALTAAILGIGFVIFVFVYGDLKTNPFVQGITGLSVALVIAVVLFSAVPGSSAKVKVPIGLAGAAAFYWLILPRIEPYVFPLHAFTGYIAYEKKTPSEPGFNPVEGAEVEIGGTSSRATTDTSGKFIIPNVPSHLDITDLIISRGGRVHQIKVKNFPDRVYYIPREPQTIQSDRYSIPEELWVENKSSPCSAGKEFESTTQFSLRTDVPTQAGYADLLVEVRSVEKINILSARRSEQTGGNRIQTEDESKVQRWEFPVNNPQMRIAISVCLGTLKKGVDIPKASLKTLYWFEKVE